MARQALGIYLNNTIISGVVTEQQGKGTALISHAAIHVPDTADLHEKIKWLLDQLAWKGGDCSCGIPLSWLSVRNLNFPFLDKKKIEQTLAYELDDHLIDPIDELLVSYEIIDTDQHQSKLLTFAAQKERIQSLLALFKSLGMDPDIVCPGVVPFSEAVSQIFPDEKIVVLQAGTSSLAMALVVDGVCKFCRELPYPDEFLNFSFEELEQSSRQPFDDGFIERVGEVIRRNLGFIRFHQFKVDNLQKIVGTGLLAQHSEICKKLERQLAIPVEPVELPISSGDVESQSDLDASNYTYETALALSQAALQKKTNLFNFRKGEFKKRRTLISSKKQLVYAGLACLVILFAPIMFYWSDVRSLKEKDDILKSAMDTLYLQKFPQTSRIQNAYMQMKAAVVSQGSSADRATWGRGLTMLDILADISSQIPESITIEVSRMVIDTQSVRLRGETENFNNVNEVKRLLAVSDLYNNVQILSASADNRSGKVRFEVQLELREDV